MKSTTLKAKLNSIGYEAEYKKGIEGIGWYLREHGTTNYFYVGDLISLEEWYFMKENYQNDFLSEVDGDIIAFSLEDGSNNFDYHKSK